MMYEAISCNFFVCTRALYSRFSLDAVHLSTFVIGKDANKSTQVSKILQSYNETLFSPDNSVHSRRTPCHSRIPPLALSNRSQLWCHLAASVRPPVCALNLMLFNSTLTTYRPESKSLSTPCRLVFQKSATLSPPS